MKIKSLCLPSAVIQSPMSGWTDLPFRRVAREKGLSFAFVEMILADAVVAGSERTLEMMRSSPADRPLGVQMVGYTPESLSRAAGMMEAAGFDLIDLNLGCPVKKVTCKGGGSAILKEPDKARAIFSGMVSSVNKVPITVKMRLGYDDPSGQEALRIAGIAEECGISALTVHGRTRRQGYSGMADYEAIGRIKKAVRIPVIGNGDVTDGRSAQRLMEVSGCDGIMIGRGGVGYPWIYREAAAVLEGRPAPAAPGFQEIKSTLLRHLELQLFHTPVQAHFLMRRIACSYFKRMAGAGEFRDRINDAGSIEEIRDIIELFEPAVCRTP
ncbi:MAG: tRNA dihydrouridine synthase DusB [Candidatus Lindowbacteria bacterium RIFCSPLOWO2_12_FULL_62_27]|nr:MAG: tRNA dihydrouridine synthase DusB [Candidatus Lindowbacteria bacterium RIFCSPLOWO2_12_FULL_62_27]OGH62963.1 MAG: tRNA dihydrouridine synthase DusB [Candidatus Lindowbacteria bacterium RIFCSPLOWO2_02_FULL_62_12]